MNIITRTERCILASRYFVVHADDYQYYRIKPERRDIFVAPPASTSLQAMCCITKFC